MEIQTTIKVKIEKEDGDDGHSNIKQEPNVEYLLILPPEKELDNFPLPKKEEKDITEQCEDIESEDLKFTDQNQNIKHEPSVEYLLVLPREDEAVDSEFPLPIKEENEKTASNSEKSMESNKEFGKLQKKTASTDQEIEFWKQKEVIEAKECSVKVQKLIKSPISNWSLFDKKHVCTKCSPSEIFKSEKDLRNHQELKHLFCNKCNMAYKHLNTFKTHKCLIKMCPVFKCEYCAKQFSNRGNLSQHIAIHLDTMKKACKKCGKRFVKARLEQHLRVSHGKKLYSCDLCPQKCKTKFSLEAHMMSHLKPYKCKVCDKTFSEKRYFLEHQINHDNPNPFKCSKCTSSYTRLTSLSRHMQTAHCKARNFACSECKYKGKTQDDLTTHQKSHTLAYQCDVCKRKFSRSTLLNQHRVLHDNPHAYQCDVCKLSFTQKKMLKDHTVKRQEFCQLRVANGETGNQNGTIASYLKALKSKKVQKKSERE